MAKFVIAGKSNCPYYAKAELLGDNLTKNLAEFHVHKIVKDPKDWDKWLEDLCMKNNWKHKKSPIIWRELVDRGGKGMLLGDANDFQEYAKDFYGIKSELKSEDLTKISAENERTCKIVEEEKLKVHSSINPLNLTISNPASPILYFVINEILSENVFGNRDIFVRLYSKNKTANIEGIRMEIEDLASPNLRNIKVVQQAEEAFTNCDFVILLDELELLQTSIEDENEQKYYNPYISLAKDIDQYAKATCKILISPFKSRSEIYALVNVFSLNLKRINPKKYLMGNSMCDEMIAKAVLAQRLKINPGFVSNVVLIGQSYEDSFYLDLSYGRVTDYDGAVWAPTNTHWLNLVHMVADKDWIRKELLHLVHDRDNQISEKLKRSAVLTFAQSIAKLVRLWNIEHPDESSFYSAIVCTKGNYTIREDIYLSVPVKFENGAFYFIKNYMIKSNTQSVIEEIVQDTKKRISTRYVDEMHVKNGQEWKLSIPHVIF